MWFRKAVNGILQAKYMDKASCTTLQQKLKINKEVVQRECFKSRVQIKYYNRTKKVLQSQRLLHFMNHDQGVIKS